LARRGRLVSFLLRLWLLLWWLGWLLLWQSLWWGLRRRRWLWLGQL
jgi:hypothetical protein